MAKKTMNNKLRAGNLPGRRAFTLVEVLIVAAILGIIAAIIIPEIQGHVTRAKESQAKQNLRVLREAIERYANDHNGVAPGYFMNKSTNTPTAGVLLIHLVTSSPSYLRELPMNPLSNLNTPLVLDNSTEMSTEPTQTSTYGWIYKPSTMTIKLNYSGTDSDGKEYFSY